RIPDGIGEDVCPAAQCIDLPNSSNRHPLAEHGRSQEDERVAAGSHPCPEDIVLSARLPWLSLRTQPFQVPPTPVAERTVQCRVALACQLQGANPFPDGILSLYGPLPCVN